MEHLSDNVSDSLIENFCLYKASNNLDKKDNMDLIPSQKAVYAVFGRVNGKPANCRFVAKTNNLKAAIEQHFSNEESNEQLRKFFQSIKIKTINFQLFSSNDETSPDQLKKEWEALYKPKCTEEMNEVF